MTSVGLIRLCVYRIRLAYEGLKVVSKPRREFRLGRGCRVLWCATAAHTLTSMIDSSAPPNCEDKSRALPGTASGEVVPWGGKGPYVYSRSQGVFPSEAQA